jgi:hypothetical protein
MYSKVNTEDPDIPKKMHSKIIIENVDPPKVKKVTSRQNKEFNECVCILFSLLFLTPLVIKLFTLEFCYLFPSSLDCKL